MSAEPRCPQCGHARLRLADQGDPESWLWVCQLRDTGCRFLDRSRPDKPRPLRKAFPPAGHAKEYRATPIVKRRAGKS